MAISFGKRTKKKLNHVALKHFWHTESANYTAFESLWLNAEKYECAF